MLGSRRPFVRAAGRFSDDAHDLAERFRRGDQRAFVEIHTAHAPALSRQIGRVFPRPLEREEACQEVWLLVLRKAGAFDPALGTLSAWLRAVAKNRCKELLRARGRRPDPREALDESASAADDLASPDAAMRRERARVAVERFLSQLSHEQAAMLRLSLMEERTHDEVATLTGYSARHCKYLRKKLIGRALTNPALRAALEELVDG
jgi:RNA polymerase sigma-70 factor (ECF subfamily)